MRTKDGEVIIERIAQVKKVVFHRHYPGYHYERSLIEGSEFGGPDFIMICCYSDYDGGYMGDAAWARYITKRLGISKVQKAFDKHKTCSIGFHKGEQKWYGWSHRSVVGFGIGNKIFDEDYGSDDTLFIEHGKEEIKNMEDAKLSAMLFADYVS